MPRSRQAELNLSGRPDPISFLEEQAVVRFPDLVPIRHGRMLESPFAFYRGAALVMASDLSRTPSSGLTVQLCGDAHLVNFGLFGTAERNLVFDANDFDETHVGPWEWDVKRLAASFEVAAHANGFSHAHRHEIVLEVGRSYREAMAEFAEMKNLEVWYARLDIEAILADLAKRVSKRFKQGGAFVTKARSHDSRQALDKLTHIVNGTRRFISNPPLIEPIDELLSSATRAELEAAVLTAFAAYRTTLPEERRVVFDQFQMVELARKVVGVGSVGTRCWVALFLGIDDEDPLFLQVKQAEASVLERFTGSSRYENHGQRVVAGQKLMQSAGDMFLGWSRAVGIDGVTRDFYIRQLRDWKGSFPVEEMVPKGMLAYANICAWTLARAHARSGDRVAISAYLGKSAAFDDALVTFARAYAEQNEKDHAALAEAVRSGRLAAVTESSGDA